MNFTFIREMLLQMSPALRNTLLITFLSAGLGWLLAIGIALVRVKRIRILSNVCAVYVSLMRSVPLVIIMFFTYYAVPQIIAYYRYEQGLSVASVAGNTSLLCPVAAMSLSEAAFASEVFRSALEAVPHGQMEAAHSVGMTSLQAYLRIVFPQAVVIALPNMGGLFIGLLKSSTLAYYSGVVEITGYAYTLASPTYQFLEAFFVISVLYELLSFLFSRIFSCLEQNFGKYRKGVISV
ncbi:MAG: amino acid ABC transporter permease [Lachnospiraceae bacterium]|nr:amino acid ABC transporter permease [Lachnospiraceae bacterium]